MSNRGVNNSNVLSGEKQHIIVVNKDDVDKIKEYTEALGTTSLHDSLSVLSSLETSVSQKAKAISDLILLRHILSGEIQFKEKRLFSLFQSVIGKKFENIGKIVGDYNTKLPNTRIPFSSLTTNDVKKVIAKLDNNEKDISVIARPLVQIMLIFASAAGASYIPFFTIVYKKYADTLDNITDNIKNVNDEIRRVYMREIPFHPQPMYHQLTDEKKLLIDQLEDQRHLLEDKWNEFRDSDFIKENFTNLLLTNGNVFYPILIGLLASMQYAHGISRQEDDVYAIAIIKLIDRFLSTNTEVLHIINDPESGSLVPEPLRNDPLGMALFFKYINKININSVKLEQSKSAAKIQREFQRGITNIEKQTGTNVLSMNTFRTLNKSLDDCGICLKPLASVLMGKPIEVCENHHMFHDKCIAKWMQNSRDKKCPTCRQPIKSDVFARIKDINLSEDVVAINNANNGVGPGAVNANNGVGPGAVNANNGVGPGAVNANNGVLPGAVNNDNAVLNVNNYRVRGGRKQRTLRYKKRKSTRKNTSTVKYRN